MKKQIITVLFIALLAMQFLVVKSYSDSYMYNDFMNTDGSIQLPDGKTISDMIKDYGQKSVDRWLVFGKDVRGIPNDSYCNIDTYYVSYGIDEVNNITPECLYEIYNKVWPSIHIPIYCIIDDIERSVGEVRLKPTLIDLENITWGYTSTIVYHSLEHEPYKSGKECDPWVIAPSAESIAQFCINNGAGEYKGATLLHYNDLMFSSLSDILLICTDQGEFVYDLSNTAGANIQLPLTRDDIQFYTLQEYKELRVAYEAKLSNNEGIGGSGLPKAARQLNNLIWLWILGAVFVFGIIVFLLLFKRKNHG